MSDVTVYLARWLAEAMLLASLLGLTYVAVVALVGLFPIRVSR